MGYEITEKGFKLAEAKIELPPFTAADAGKVLTVKADGTLEWKTPA